MRAVAAFAAVTLGGLVASQSRSLQVLRVSPSETAEATDLVTVVFDRPVAGQLDGTVDPRTVFSIVPAVEGRIEWRDPITLRFTPAEPLPRATRYTVTIGNAFQAMDGSRLDQPYRFSFRVGGPRAIGGSPVQSWGVAQHLRPDAVFELLVTGPVDLALVSRLAHLSLDERCEGPATIALTATGQRRVNAEDPGYYRYSDTWPPNPRATELRRVVRLQPAQRLPSDCTGALSMPAAFDDEAMDRVAWQFATYGPLRLRSVQCTNSPLCPAGYAVLEFTTPVRGSEVLRGVRLTPTAEWTVSDTAMESTSWMLEGALRQRTTYAITLDTSLRDVFGQTVSGERTTTLATTGYAPGVEYPGGRVLVERESFRTLAVRHVNIDTLLLTQAAVPESLEARVLAAPEWNLDDAWPVMAAAGSTRRAIPVRAAADTPLVSAVRVPTYNAARPGQPTLTAVRITGNRVSGESRMDARVALVQVTNLGLAGRLGADEAVVWVTTLHDGRARPGATVTLHGRDGRVRGRGTTDAQGLTRLTGLAADSAAPAERGGFEGYVAVTWESDRALLAFDAYSWELSPWRFNVQAANADERIPAAAAVFTERGIYRPGEVVHAKAIVRTGTLGALRVPARGDSIRWVFSDREEGTIRDTVVAGTSFGTAAQAVPIAATTALGTYRVGVHLKRSGRWVELARTTYRVAEYRPPEFLVTVTADTAGRLAGDTLTAAVEARYLFGAPMARVPVRWTLRRLTLWPWELDIPGTSDFYVGEGGWWWEEEEAGDGDGGPRAETVGSGTDTLDGSGRATLRVGLGAARRGRPSRAVLQATVTDVNRQVVVATAVATVHPAAFYVAARPQGSWFWTAGTPVSVDVVAVRPGGGRVPGVAVRGAVVRREWHVVHRRRDGVDQRVGEWVSDTVAQCDLTTGDGPVPCRFTPRAAGSYVVVFRARDPSGREATTSFYRWASGRDWVPWEDESQFKMDVVPDRSRYDVGDTATILLASPFAGAEAWVSVEREGVIEQRRLRLESNATVLRLPLTEAHVPNVYVSVVVMRGRSAPPGGINDPGRPALRVGYAELRVTPSVKRLAVDVRPLAAEYRPGDSARVRVRVRDARGAGRRAEVTLWAVDEGVLALTGYRTPDPVDLIYRPRGVSLRLASSLASVAAQVAEEEGLSLKGDRAPGGGGGLEGGDVLRSRFSSTAFYLGAVETDEGGEAMASARLPDNLTTFRVMAVAVTAGDRYGSGESSLLVTRPLLARPALPRFLRAEDRFTAGVVVHRRSGPAAARVTAAARGVLRTTPATRAVTVPADRGTEVRFGFRGASGDTAVFRFDVGNGRDSDAVLTRLPVRPSWVPRAHSVAGSITLTGGVELALPADIDPDRSRLVFSIGTSPLALVAGMSGVLRVYPFDCTEQIVDVVLPLVAMVRAGAPDGRRLAPADARAQIDEAIAVLVRRQRPDGSIGLWSASSWSTPWLSAYAGDALLAARAAGFAVPDSVLGRLAGYLTTNYEFHDGAWGPVSPWGRAIEIVLAENVAAVDYLSRLGRPDVARENDLLRRAPQMTFEDRARLAEVVARRGATDAARSLLGPLWASVRVEGRRAVLPDAAARAFYFWSARRPIARLLSATLAADSAHALVGPLVETLVEQGRAITWWNTHDYGIAVQALSEFTARQQRAARRGYTVGAAGRVLFRSAESGDVMREHSASLTGLLVAAPDGSRRLALNLAAPSAGRGTPLYFFATVHEVPRVRPVRPDQRGIEVERWYEDYATGRPTTSVEEGSLVRVRLRIRVPAERRFLALTDPLPAGLEAVDLSLRTAGAAPGPGAWLPEDTREEEEVAGGGWRWGWYFGAWDGGWWSPFDHRELRDDRVAYVATYLWPGTYTATYVARATTPGVFTAPPAHAEEMYNPAVQGRSDGGAFTVRPRAP